MELDVPTDDTKAHGDVEEYLHSLLTIEKDVNK